MLTAILSGAVEDGDVMSVVMVDRLREVNDVGLKFMCCCCLFMAKNSRVWRGETEGYVLLL